MKNGRWTWTFAAYWAKNIKVSVLDQGWSWPGFRYTDEEEETIGKLADRVSRNSYGWGVILNAFMFVGAVFPLAFGLGGLLDYIESKGHKPTDVEALALVVLMMAIAFAVVFPLTVALTGRIVVSAKSESTSAVDPDRVRKLSGTVVWQFCRLGLLMSLALFVGVLVLDWNSAAWPMIRKVGEIAGPIVAGVTLYLMFGRKKRRE